MVGVIQAVQEQELTLTSNTASIPFSAVDLRTRSANCCGWLNHNEGSSLFSILESGIYDISFGTNITSNTAGIVSVGLYANGVLIPGTQRDVTIATAGDWIPVSFEKALRVCCKGDASLTVRAIPTSTYAGGGTVVITDTEIPIIKNANLKIIRETGN